MPNHTFVFNDDDFGCTITSEDELWQLELASWHPQTLEPWDSQDAVRDFVNGRAVGYPLWRLIADLPTQEETDAKTAIVNREQRNQLLADSDWTQMNDSPLSNEDKTAWATYRQTLRDITADESWPNVTFPATP